NVTYYVSAIVGYLVWKRAFKAVSYVFTPKALIKLSMPCPCPPSAGTSQSLTGSHRRRGVNTAPRQEPPAQHARLGEERIHVAVARADIDKPIGYRRRGVNNVARGETPDGYSGAGSERIDFVVVRADVDDAIGYTGRGENI